MKTATTERFSAYKTRRLTTTTVAPLSTLYSSITKHGIQARGQSILHQLLFLLKKQPINPALPVTNGMLKGRQYTGKSNINNLNNNSYLTIISFFKQYTPQLDLVTLTRKGQKTIMPSTAKSAEARQKQFILQLLRQLRPSLKYRSAENNLYTLFADFYMKRGPLFKN